MYKITVKNGKTYNYADQVVYPNTLANIGEDTYAGGGTFATGIITIQSGYWISATMAADQTNVGTGVKVSFDTKEAGNLSINGSNQIVLSPGFSYYCQAFVQNNASYTGVSPLYMWYNATSNTSFNNVITPSSSTPIEVRIAQSGIERIYSAGSCAFVRSM